CHTTLWLDLSQLGWRDRQDNHPQVGHYQYQLPFLKSKGPNFLMKRDNLAYSKACLFPPSVFLSSTNIFLRVSERIDNRESFAPMNIAPPTLSIVVSCLFLN